MKNYIGIDNGTTGSIGIISTKGQVDFFEIPKFVQQSYTKKKQNITRINTMLLKSILLPIQNSFVVLERPLTMKAYHATTSAARALEATLVVLEMIGIPYMYIDSKEWQKEMLPQGIKGSVELKKASLDIGCRLFPQHKDVIVKHKDADGLLIAEFARRKQL